MNKIFKRLEGILISGVLLCTSTMMVYSADERYNNCEESIESFNIDELKDEEFESSNIMVILKKEFSSPDLKIDYSIFDCIDYSKVENLSTSPFSNMEQFRNIICVDLNKGGRDEVKKAIEKISKRNEVYYAGPNLIHQLEDQSCPNDPEIYNQTSVLVPYNNMKLLDAWDITVGSRDVIVANNESLDYNHPDITANLWTNPQPSTNETHGFNFNDSQGNVLPLDGNYHGTLTAGIIGAVGNNNIGVSGVAQKVQIMAVMSGNDQQFAQAINFISSNNVSLMNISLAWGSTYSSTIKQCFNNFNGLVTVSAGNNSQNLDSSPLYPASYSNECSNVLAVAAVDNNDTLYSYSNYGVNTVSIAAPANYRSLSNNQGYTTGGGTSSAAPVVIGIAALIKSVAPYYSWQQVKSAILNNSDTISSYSTRVNSGRRINAYKALKAVTAESGTYFIRNYNSNLYLDAASPAYTNLMQHTFMGGNNERFEFRNNTLKCLQNGNYLKIGSYYATNFQSAVFGTSDNVYFSKNTDGTYCILKKDGSTWKALDVYNGSTSNATVGWSNYTSPINRQKWVLEDGNEAAIAHGTYYITNKNSGKNLDLNESNGTVIQHGFNGGDNQKWEIIPQSNGKFKIKTKSTNYPGYLNYNYTTSYNGIVSGSGLDVDIYLNSNGTYKIHMPNYVYCLNIENSSTSNNAQTVWEGYNNSLNQQWEIIRIS